MFSICLGLMFFQYFIHCSFIWHHRCGKFFTGKTFRWLFSWYMDFYNCVTNEHMWLNRKHFSQMLTCCIRKSTQVGECLKFDTNKMTRFAADWTCINLAHDALCSGNWLEIMLCVFLHTNHSVESIFNSWFEFLVAVFISGVLRYYKWRVINSISEEHSACILSLDMG